MSGPTCKCNEMESISLSEWDWSEEAVELSERDRRTIDSKINSDKSRLQYRRKHGECFEIGTRNYVGITTLPSGLTIEVNPKAAGKNALELIKYGYRKGDVLPAETDIDVTTGAGLMRPIISLFKSKLEEILQRNRLDEERKTKRGRQGNRLNIRAAIDMQAGDFSAQNRLYEKKIRDRDTPANRILLEAALQAVELGEEEHSEFLRKAISRFRKREDVSRPRSWRPAFEQAQKKNLPDPYPDALELAEIILQKETAADIIRGTRSSYTYFISMQDVFEEVIERAIDEQFSNEYRVEDQDEYSTPFEGPSSVGIKPDIVLYQEETPKVAIDAKWQTEIRNEDVHKSITYQAALGVPSVMVYPKSEEVPSLEGDYTLESGEDIQVVQINVGKDTGSYEEFVSVIESEVKEKIQT